MMERLLGCLMMLKLEWLGLSPASTTTTQASLGSLSVSVQKRNQHLRTSTRTRHVHNNGSSSRSSGFGERGARVSEARFVLRPYGPKAKRPPTL